MPSYKAFHSSVYFNDNLYIIGGINQNKKVTNECLRFNYKEKKWNFFNNLTHARANCSLCIYNDSFLYVFRGRNNYDVINSIEFISLLGNLQENKWNLFIPNDYGFIWFACQNSLVIAIDKEKILICGGEDKEGKLFKESILFEPGSRNVYRGGDLEVNSSFKTQGCLIKGNIYAMDTKNQLNNEKHGIHFFDKKENKWKFFI